MRITVIAVGKVKEAFFRDAIDEYSKRLSRYVKLNIVEVADEMTPDGASDAEEDEIRLKEGRRIISKIPAGDVVCTLEINGKKFGSEQFADWIEKQGTYGNSSICFIIGGSLGLHPEVSSKASLHLSFSDMTFPHQLMRVILTEQIYRAYRIIKGEPYHK